MNHIIHTPSHVLVQLLAFEDPKDMALVRAQPEKHIQTDQVLRYLAIASHALLLPTSSFGASMDLRSVLGLVWVLFQWFSSSLQPLGAC